jgi:hypothetical protein
MPTEAVNCPACGSSATVEFKPENYICSHCDTKFKWRDPNVQKVVMEKKKCACGDEATAECQSCGAPVCARHKRTLPDTVHSEARQYFCQKILPVLNWSDHLDKILCENCLTSKGKELQDKVEKLKGNGKLCAEKSCFSMELVRCDACGNSRHCSKHTPMRKKFKKALFGSKPTALTYEKVCFQCYSNAREKQSNIYWE